jgi:hypothetical protein
MKVAHNMSILLWLRDSKNTNASDSPLMVRITVNGKRINWSLGKKVNPNHWITGAGLLKTSAKESKLVNPYLNQVRGNIQSHFNLLASQYEKVNPEMVRDAFMGIQKYQVKQHSLIEAFTLHNSKTKEKAMMGKMSMKTWRRLDIGRKKNLRFFIQGNEIQGYPFI